MSDEERDPLIKQTQIKDLKVESGSEDLLDTPAMQPYMRLAIALMQGKDLVSAAEEIAKLSLEQRYVWRVASALKWAFADFDNVSVEADRQTLSVEDQQRLSELLNHRPLQFCLFLSTLLGQKQMELVMVSAIRNSRSVSGFSEGFER